MTIVYVYAKEGKVKVIPHDDPTLKEQHNKRLSHGWKHTATIDACLWIESLYDNTDNIVSAVKKLSQ